MIIKIDEWEAEQLKEMLEDLPHYMDFQDVRLSAFSENTRRKIIEQIKGADNE